MLKFASFHLAALAALSLLIIGGCGDNGINPANAKGVEIGRSVHGRPIEAVTFGDGPERVLIGATIHGNEWAGTPVVERLMEYLPNHGEILAGRTVAIIPVINPDGFAHKTRGNANGVDINRNFPAENRENSKRYGMTALSEPESQVLYTFIDKFDPERIVIFHQPLHKVDWDGPAQPLAKHMAKHTILPENRIGARPGSMGSHYGVDRKLPIITYELPRHAEKETTDTLWASYGRATLAAITYPDGVSAAAFVDRPRWDLWIPILMLVSGVFAISIGIWSSERKRPA